MTCLSLFVFVSLLSVLSADVTLDQGNMQLKTALDVAAIDAYNEGQWGSTIGRESGVSLPFYCAWDRASVAYPGTRTINGALYDVLNENKIIFSFVNTTLVGTDSLGESLTLIDTTTGQPSGVYAEWHSHLVSQLNEEYNSDIQIEYLIFNSPARALDAVNQGEAHLAVTPFKISGRYGSRKRTDAFLIGCPDHALSHGRLFRKNDNVVQTTYEEVRQIEESLQIGVLDNEYCSFYKTIYTRSTVSCVSESELMENVDSYDFVGINMDGVTELDGILPAHSYYGSLYRKDAVKDAVEFHSAAAPQPSLVVMWAVAFSAILALL